MIEDVCFERNVIFFEIILREIGYFERNKSNQICFEKDVSYFERNEVCFERNKSSQICFEVFCEEMKYVY